MGAQTRETLNSESFSYGMRNKSGERLRIIAYGGDPWIAAASEKHHSQRYLAKLTKSKLRVSSSAWPMGLEIQLQERSFAGRPVTTGCPRLLKDFGIMYQPRELPRPLSRYPPSELAAYYLFRSCENLSLTSLCKANALLGGPGFIRTHEHQSSKFPSSHRSIFLPAKKVGPEIEYLVSKINGKADLNPFEFAAAAMIHTLMIHPFSNGNGRLANLLFQYCLFKRGIIDYPLIPLNPFMEANRSEWLHSLITFSVNGTLASAFCYLRGAVRATARGVDDLLS